MHIKVIHSTSIWLPQTQTWMYNHVKFLSSDIENHIVCGKTENLDQFTVPNIHCLANGPRWRYYWDKGLRTLRIRRHLGYLTSVAKEIGAQIFHSHFGNVGWANIKAAKMAGVRHIVTFYGLDVNRLPTIDPRWYRRYRELFDHVDKILCEGPYMAKSIVKLGCPEKKIVVHHLGVAVNDIQFQPRAWKSGEPLKVLIAGSFREKKGIPYALEALGHLQREVPLQVTIIGDANWEPHSRKEKQKILATLEKYELHGKTRLLGYQPYIFFLKEAYKHHIFLSPSVTAEDGDTEGGAPVSIIEMAASGMPVISTKHCDIPEVIQNEVTGLLAEERNVDDIIGHLKWFVKHSNQWEPMLIAGRQKVEKEFNVRIQAEKQSEFYRKVAGCVEKRA